ncbi:hypothetical protein I551_7443 [Mycobacterium ulcerans str. Harvey]|uniref:Uncharacterized protein n=1 Tax=Mycobacterium ulcerans str. Harvey TaxID=1299332 RepID=A0ABN0QNA6_MYCUL|nr:hypothetical protein I551_7443 [Mycobacterium ulcerans str. Harvey]
MIGSDFGQRGSGSDQYAALPACPAAGSSAACGARWLRPVPRPIRAARAMRVQARRPRLGRCRAWLGLSARQSRWFRRAHWARFAHRDDRHG